MPTSLINLGEEFTDAQAPQKVRCALIKAANSDPSLHQYTLHEGLPRLTKIVGKLYSKVLSREVNPRKNVLITAGATEALNVAFRALTKPGDEWIIIEPAYPSYIPMLKLMGVVPRITTLKHQEMLIGRMSSRDWKLDIEELRSLFNEKTRGILLNNPNNPIGKCYTKEELELIAKLAKEFGVTIISDEAHEWIIYKPQKHLRIASFPDMFDRTISIGSGGKSFSLTGWRVGWAYGPAHILEKMKEIHTNTVLSAATPLQEAIASGLEEALEKLDDEDLFFKRQASMAEVMRNRLAAAFVDMAMAPTIPEAGNSMIVNCATRMERELPFVDSEQSSDERSSAFNFWIINNTQVIGVPLTYFFSEQNKFMGRNYIRYCFHKKSETIETAVQRLRQFKI